MEQAEIQAMMQELASIAFDMDSQQLTALHRARIIIEKITASQCRQIIRRSGDRPCLQMFMSNGWSTDIRSRFKSSRGGVEVARIVRLRTEFVVQRTILKASIISEMHIAMKIERPGPLAANTCDDIWSAAFDVVPLFMFAGHTGISVSIYTRWFVCCSFWKEDDCKAQPFFKP